MAYQFKENLDVSLYKDFIKKYSLVSFMQDNGWGCVKENWKSIRVGLYKDKQLVAVSLVLIKKIIGNLCMAYVPRGYVIDFLDKDMLQEFTLGIQKLAKRENCYMVKIDPNFCCSEKCIVERCKEEDVKIPVIFSKDYQIKHNYLLELGYRHTGYHKEISKTLQPRYHMMIPFVNDVLSPLDEDSVLKSFQKRTRSYLGGYHEKRGVFYEHSSDLKCLDTFIKVLNSTESRQGIHLRNRHYFEMIMNHFKERAVLFFGKLDLNVYLSFLENNQGKEEEIEEVKRLLDCGESILTLSAALVIMPSNDNGVRVSEYLYAGNELLFSKLQISVGLVYDICKYSIMNKCTYLNLGGLDGNLDDHLAKFKSRFNSIVMEFIGEYDLPIYKGRYFFITAFLPMLKKIYKIIKR